MNQLQQAPLLLLGQVDQPLTIENRAMAGIARGLRLNTASMPSSTSCLRAR
jgi:hypothetical protein